MINCSTDNDELRAVRATTQDHAAVLHQRLLRLPRPSLHAAALASSDRSSTRLLRRSVRRLPSDHFEVCLLDVGGDLLPLILFANPSLGGSSSRLAHRPIGDEEAQAIRQVRCIPALEGESCFVDDFPIFRDVTGQHIESGAHCVQKG
jgi:hypothetical protein